MSRPPPLSTSGRPARYRRPFPCAGVRRRTSPVIKRRVPVQYWQLSFSGLNEFPELGMPPLPHDPRRSLSPPFVYYNASHDPLQPLSNGDPAFEATDAAGAFI